MKVSRLAALAFISIVAVLSMFVLSSIANREGEAFAPKGIQNLVPNPDFETLSGGLPAGWRLEQGGGFPESTWGTSSDANTGARSLVMTTTDTTFFAKVISPRFTVTPSLQLHTSYAEKRISGPREIAPLILFYNGGWQVGACQPSVQVAPGSWQTLNPSTVCTVPASANQAEVVLQLGASLTSNVVLFDSLTIGPNLLGREKR